VTPTTPIRVVVAEDEVLVREGIRRLFETVEGIEVVDAVRDLPALRAAVASRQPDVVVTDVGLPPTWTDEGIRFSAELRLGQPGIGVVILGRDAKPDYATTLFDGGASGRAYLLKDRVVNGAAFAETVRTVAQGGSHVDVRVLDTLLQTSPGRRAATLATLTPRDAQVLGLMAEGRSNAAIARELAVTSRAIERHVGSIFTKLGIQDSPDHSRRVLAVLAYLGKGGNGAAPAP
jgi:DNA-binding NarL/FixJ family response regulator